MSTGRWQWESLGLLFLSAALLRLLVFDSYTIHSVQLGNWQRFESILGLKFYHGVRIPFLWKRGAVLMPLRDDLVIFSCGPEKSDSCVGRVIGLPGDLITKKSQEIRLNGEFVGEDGLQFAKEVPFLVPPDEVIVLSPFLGSTIRELVPVAKDHLLGKPWIVWFSKDVRETGEQWDRKINWDRLFISLD